MNEFDLTKILDDWAADVVTAIRVNLEETGTNASGRTSESLEYTITDDNHIIITGRPYFRSVEEGRPAGKVPYNFTDIISQWIDDKGIASHFGITNEKEKRSVAYLIGRKIKEEGTDLYNKGGREDVYTNVIESMVGELQEAVADGYKAAVERTIVKSYNR